MEQAERDVEILTDCYMICTNSNNLDTVISRMELGMQKTYTLLQAEQAGILNTSLINNKINYFRGNIEYILIQALRRSYNYQITEANELKTDTGRRNRLDKYIEKTEPIIMPYIVNQ